MESYNSEKKLNPFFSIWLNPRKTMKEALDDGPKYIFLLFLIGSLVSALDYATGRTVGDKFNTFSGMLSIILISTLIYFLISFFISPILYGWLGRLLGGEGTNEEVRYAFGYGFIPYLYSLIIVWVPSLFLFKMDNFTTDTPILVENPLMLGIYSILVIIDVVIMIWGFVIMHKCIAEAHQFSTWLALLISVIIFVSILVIVLLPLLLFL